MSGNTRRCSDGERKVSSALDFARDRLRASRFEIGCPRRSPGRENGFGRSSEKPPDTVTTHDCRRPVARAACARRVDGNDVFQRDIRFTTFYSVIGFKKHFIMFAQTGKYYESNANCAKNSRQHWYAGLGQVGLTFGRRTGLKPTDKCVISACTECCTRGRTMHEIVARNLRKVVGARWSPFPLKSYCSEQRLI